MLVNNPFNSKEAYLYSSYSTLTKTGQLGTQHREPQEDKNVEKTAKLLHTFILETKHPCIIARSSVRGNGCRFGVYPTLGSDEATAGLSRDLMLFLEERPLIQHPYASFMAVFERSQSIDEITFEKLLWKQLTKLHQASQEFFPWSNKTSADPSKPDFGFSFAGKAFYVVGMHPNSSRKARQFPHPMLVFNPHEQFEQLRAQNAYDKVKKVVRRNDLKLQGSLNPMLDDFGNSSEAKQYSGRAVSDHWKCPFLANNPL